MKKLLLSIYLYMGIFFGVCLILWIVTGEEPSALIMGISAAVGVESVAAGAIRIYENREQHNHEKEINKYAEQHDGTGYGRQGGNQLEAETEFPEVPDDGGAYGDSSGGDAV